MEEPERADGPRSPRANEVDGSRRNRGAPRRSTSGNYGRRNSDKANYAAGRGGSSCTAQAFPSGSSKNVNRAPRELLHLARLDAALHELCAGRATSATTICSALHRARRRVGDARPDRDRARRAGGVSWTKRRSSLTWWSWSASNPDLLGIEGLRAIHVRHGNGHELELPVHAPSVRVTDLATGSAGTPATVAPRLSARRLQLAGRERRDVSRPATVARGRAPVAPRLEASRVRPLPRRQERAVARSGLAALARRARRALPRPPAVAVGSGRARGLLDASGTSTMTLRSACSRTSSPRPHAEVAIGASAGRHVLFERFGLARFTLFGAEHTLDLFWLRRTGGASSFSLQTRRAGWRRTARGGTCSTR